ncbi:MAG TPA: hypothetical protein ENN46_04780 [Candidatus Woesearchaeota archaeon]|nr:hypothetical protein [Candidatus Woesearchaeota archaeon]
MAKPKETEKSPIDVEIKEHDKGHHKDEKHDEARKKAQPAQKKGRKHVAEGMSGLNFWAYVALIEVIIIVVLLAYNPGRISPKEEHMPPVDEPEHSEEYAEEEPIEYHEEPVEPEYIFTVNVSEGEEISLIDRFIDYETIWFSEPLSEEGFWLTERGDAGSYDVNVVMTTNETLIERTVLVVVREAELKEEGETEESEEVPHEQAEEETPEEHEDEESTVTGEGDEPEEEDSNIILENIVIEVGNDE